jgi:hypothetical protein
MSRQTTAQKQQKPTTQPANTTKQPKPIEYTPSQAAIDAQTYETSPKVRDLYHKLMGFHNVLASTNPTDKLREEKLEEFLTQVEPLFMEIQQEQLLLPQFKTDLTLLRLNDGQLKGKVQIDNNQETFQNSSNPFSIEKNSIEHFITWINSKSPTPTGFGTNISLKTDFCEGTGIVALRDLNYEENIINIPRSSMISSDIFFTDPYYQPLNILNPQVSKDQKTALTLAIAFERYRGKESNFEPYLNLLPNYVPCLVYATIDDVLALRNTKNYLYALKIMYNFIQQYIALICQIEQFNRQVDWNLEHEKNRINAKNQTKNQTKSDKKNTQKTEIGPENPKIGLKFIKPISVLMYRWSTAMAMSRQNPIPMIQLPNGPKIDPNLNKNQTSSLLALIPGFDFANFTIPIDKKQRIINTHYNFETNSSDTTAMSNVKQGEQVYIYYGARSVTEFTFFQGFLPDLSLLVNKPPHTHADSYTFLPPPPPQTDGLDKIRTMINSRLGIGQMDSITIPFHEDKPISIKVQNSFLQMAAEQLNIKIDINNNEGFENNLNDETIHNVPNWTIIWKYAFVLTLDKNELSTLLTKLGKFPKSSLTEDEEALLSYRLLITSDLIPNDNASMKRAIIDGLIPTLKKLIVNNVNDATLQRKTPCFDLFLSLITADNANINAQIMSLQKLADGL